jgi:putative colanic acid biosynthesis UDP-glucose lipid carrier transferase
LQVFPDRSTFVWIHRTIDLVLPILLLILITSLLNIPWHERYEVMGVIAGFLLMLTSQFTGLYESWRGRSIFQSAKLIMKAWLITWAILIILAFWYKDTSSYSRLAVTSWAIITMFSLVLYRIVIRSILIIFRQSGNNIKSVAIVGAGKVGQQLAKNINENPWLGYKVTAFYDDNLDLLNQKINHIPIIGIIEHLAKDTKNKKYDEIYICLPLWADSKIKQLLNELTDTTAIVKYVPDLFSFDLMHAKMQDIKGMPVFSVFDTPLSSKTSQLIKRIEDILLSTIILILISPIMFMVGLGVKVSSPGPIFYRQTRVGWNGENFDMLKFRSMPIDTEKNGVQWGSAKNKTNTKFGQFIRSTSLDELPQFLNVLKGDMSIVGPRPERDIFVEQFRKEIPRYMQKHMVKAGITGWAQINGWRGDTCLEKRIEADLHYINNWSLWLDIRIIFLTIFKGFINKNAY